MQSEQSIGEAASNAVGAVVEKAQEVGHAAAEKAGSMASDVRSAVVNTRIASRSMALTP